MSLTLTNNMFLTVGLSPLSTLLCLKDAYHFPGTVCLSSRCPSASAFLISKVCPITYKVEIFALCTVKAVTLIFISGRGSAISSAKQGQSGSIYNMVKN